MNFKKQKRLLSQREQANAFRVLKEYKNLIDFCSNDYLGLSRDGEEFKGLQIKGSGGSRLLAGNYTQIVDFEGFLSKYHNTEEALMFNSGYNANVGFFSAVPQKGDTILYDELIHASVKDGMRLSFAKSYSFKHNNIEDLEKKLRYAEGDVYVAVESVYSMDGDSAPLIDLASFCEAKSLILVVDEAHGIGVFGEGGEGLVQYLKLEDKVPVRIITFGKAVGAHGAAVLSNVTIKNFLINFCRSFIYTTALPPYTIQSLSNSYLALRNGRLTIQLKEKIRLFKAQFTKIESEKIISSDSSIQCILFPDNELVIKVSLFLNTAGFYVKPVLSPTVKKGKERIRICIHTFNTNNQIIDLANAIKLQIAQARN
jgi:8-amino-7-oxononanoate synthase